MESWGVMSDFDMTKLMTDAFLNNDIWGGMVEEIYYTPFGGERKKIKAQVFRNGFHREGSGNFQTIHDQIKIYISRDKDDGVQEVTEKSDEVEIKSHNGNYEMLNVLSVIDFTESNYTLAVG